MKTENSNSPGHSLGNQPATPASPIVNRLIDQALPILKQQFENLMTQSRVNAHSEVNALIDSVTQKVSDFVHESMSLMEKCRGDSAAQIHLLIHQRRAKAEQAIWRKSLIFLHRMHRILDVLMAPFWMVIPTLMAAFLLIGITGVLQVRLNRSNLEIENSQLRAANTLLNQRLSLPNQIILGTKKGQIMALVPEEQWPQAQVVEGHQGRWIILLKKANSN